MSSTNRGAVRNKDDYYITPRWLVEEFLESYLHRYPTSHKRQILDCCAGGDELNGMTYPDELRLWGFNNITTIDVRDDSRALIKTDFLSLPKFNHFDMIITNPPFNLSVEITKKAIEEADVVIMLQRLNWVGSNWRSTQFWNTAPLKHVFAHNKRASFTVNGRKDSVEYAHFVFDKRHSGDSRFTLIL